MAITSQRRQTQRQALRTLVAKNGPVLLLPRDWSVLRPLGIESLEPFVRDGLIEKLPVRGLYVVAELPRPVAAEQLALVPSLVGDQDYYVSWWAGLAFHGLTDQMPRLMRVAVHTYRRPVDVEGARFQFVRLSHVKFFGWRTEQIDGVGVRIASASKAVVDGLDHPEYAGSFAEVVTALASKRISAKSLIESASRQRVRAVGQRMGWLLENIRGDDASELLKLVRSGGPYPLNPLAPASGDVDTRWNLVVNSSIDQLRSWKRT